MLKLILITYLVVFSTTYTMAQQPDVIIGKYHLPNKLDIEIFKNNGEYFGKIIALNGFEDGQTIDTNNPDKSKRTSYW